MSVKKGVRFTAGRIFQNRRKLKYEGKKV